MLGSHQYDPTFATTKAINLYVETAGSDSNGNCDSVVNACRTIQGALDRLRVRTAVNNIPMLIRHPVNVRVGVGNFAGAIISGFKTDQCATTTPGCYLNLTGTLTNFAPATGLASGNVASATAGNAALPASGWGTLTVTAAGWTVDNLVGQLIEITGGTGVGQIEAIHANTATVITITGSWFPTPDSTSTFALRDWGTVINSTVTRPADVFNAASVASGLIIDSSAGLTTGTTAVQKIHFSGQSVRVTTTGPTQFRYNKFTGSSNIIDLNPHILTLSRNVAASSTANSVFQLEAVTQLNFNRNVSTGGIRTLTFTSALSTSTTIQNNSIKGATSSAIDFGVYGNHTLIGNEVNCNSAGGDGLASFFPSVAAAGAAHVSLSADNITNCVSAISGTGSVIYQLIGTAVTGTGNTNALSLNSGAQARVGSGVTLSGNVLLDAETFTLAQMRALGNKSIAQVGTNSRFYESVGAANVTERGGHLQLEKFGATFQTCDATLEGSVVRALGGSGEGITKLCICRSDGAASPVYQWCSLQMAGAAAVVCAGGTTTACP